MAFHCILLSVKAGLDDAMAGLLPGERDTWLFLGGYVPPGTPNWHPVLKEISPKIDTRSRNGPISYTPF